MRVLLLAVVMLIMGGLVAVAKISGQATVFPYDKLELPLLGESGNVLNLKTLGSDLYVINVFASWCGTCEAEHSQWLEIAKQYSVPVYGIAYLDSQSKLGNWLSKHGNPYSKVAVDSHGTIGKLIQLKGVPETFVIKSDGEILLHHRGSMDTKIWEKRIMPLMKHN